LSEPPFDKELLARVSARLDRIGTRVSELVAPSVRLLIVPDARGEPEAAGSCVLIWHRGVRYVVTAAHVVDYVSGRRLHVGTATTFVPLPAPFLLTPPPVGQSREEDILDYAFRAVSEEEAAQLDGCQFLPASQIAERDIPQFTEPRTGYLALGYPLNRFKHRPGSGHSRGETLPYAGTISPLDKYAQLKLQPYSHVALQFPHNATFSRDGKGPSPKMNGMSGGGIFRYPPLERSPLIALPSLAAITIEQRMAERVIIGVRIGLILAAIDNARRDGLTR
jgi:hypothetical protein